MYAMGYKASVGIDFRSEFLMYSLDANIGLLLEKYDVNS